MEIKEIICKLEEALSALKSLDEEQLNEMVYYQTKLPFDKFIDATLNSTYVPEKPNTNTVAFKEMANIRITSDCIKHVQKDHPEMDIDTWLQFMAVIDTEHDYKAKSKHQPGIGTRYLYQHDCFGYCLDEFPNKKPVLVTMFKDHPNSIKNWIDNQI